MLVRRRKGFSIGSVLLLAMVVVLVSVSIAALAGFQLSSAQTTEKSRDAEYLAESAIHMVVSNLTAAPTYGTLLTEVQVFQPDPTDPARTGTVTFNPGSGLPFSTNNLNAPTTPCLGFQGAAVPPGCVRIIGIGSSRTLVRQVEVLVSVPLYPYTLSCGGNFTDLDNLVVQGAGSMANFVSSGGVPPKALPASIACLGAAPLTVANPIVVTGNIYSLAPTVIAPPAGSNIGGVVRQSANLQIPNLIAVNPAPNLTAIVTAAQTALAGGAPPLAPPGSFTGVSPIGPTINTQGTGPVTCPAGLTMNQSMLTITGGGFAGGLIVNAGNLVMNDSVMFVGGGLTVPANDVQLNHSIVYVSGNVTIGGTICGSGAILATGTVSFNAMSAVDGPATPAAPSTEVAILAGGNVTLTPNLGVANSFYQGLIYSGGNLSVTGTAANAITMAGTFVAQGNMTLAHTTVWGVPQCSALNYATWAPASNPSFGTVAAVGAVPVPPGPQAFFAVDSQGAIGGTSFTPAEVTAVHASVAGVVADPVYSAQVAGGIDPLQVMTEGALTLQAGGLSYDPNINRYTLATPVGTQCFNGAVAVPQSTFDAAAAPTATGDLVQVLLTAQGLAKAAANGSFTPAPPGGLIKDEATGLLGVGITANAVFVPPGMGTSALQINLDLNQFLNGGLPSFAVLATRVK